MADSKTSINKTLGFYWYLVKSTFFTYKFVEGRFSKCLCNASRFYYEFHNFEILIVYSTLVRNSGKEMYQGTHLGIGANLVGKLEKGPK